MTRPVRPADRARGRVIAAAVVVGVLIVVAAAVAASAYVSGKRPSAATAAEAQPSGPFSSASATPAPSSDQPSTPAPSIPGTDGLGFLGTPARCAEGDAARMMVLTATSQAVVCSRGDALYYSGWRTDTGSGTRIEGVLPAGPGWVARAPDATINITPAGLVISTSSGEFAEPATGFWAAP